MLVSRRTWLVSSHPAAAIVIRLVPSAATWRANSPISAAIACRPSSEKITGAHRDRLPNPRASGHMAMQQVTTRRQCSRGFTKALPSLRHRGGRGRPGASGLLEIPDGVRCSSARLPGGRRPTELVRPAR